LEGVNNDLDSCEKVLFPQRKINAIIILLIPRKQTIY
jgi:hypothetical protein